MPGKVFVSCGQANLDERKTAKDILDWINSEGFDAYVAIETQSIQDVNIGIIGQLKKADYYIFIDFCRDKIADGYRGSLFTNQELSIAYAMGIDNAIFLQQDGVVLEGMGKYILSNAKKFTKHEEVLSLVKAEIGKRKWEPLFSRHLVVQCVKSFPGIPYKDHTIPGFQRRWITHACVENRRGDIAAVNVMAHLIAITDQETGAVNNGHDRCDLKWALQMGYTRSIAPHDCVPFDAFGIDEANPTHVYLHSASDTIPRMPVITKAGKYLLRYEIYSENYPVAQFDLQLDLTGCLATTVAGISNL